MALLVKNPPAFVGDVRDVGLILCQQDPMEERVETHSSIYAWRIPCLGSLAGYSPQGRKKLDKLKQLTTHTCMVLVQTWIQ